MTWFEALMGFDERSPSQVRANIVAEGETLTSLANQRRFVCGQLETPSLGALRGRVGKRQRSAGKLRIREIVADVSTLHADKVNAGSLFQVASQFNLLEMASPDVPPERGVGIYEGDFTQGPACAVACGAGTIYRNYFANVSGQIGQSTTHQIDCLADIGAALGNPEAQLWEMRNGYALASPAGLVEISRRLGAMSEGDRDRLRQLLQVGVQWNTQVTVENSEHLVTQAYCSALPVAYSKHPCELWEGFARLILEASYEATICTAILNSLNTGNNRVFLTLLGGGAFGNKIGWIIEAIVRVLKLYAGWNLEIAIVSYGESKEPVRQLVERFS